jgi:hypothetical protein
MEESALFGNDHADSSAALTKTHQPRSLVIPVTQRRSETFYDAGVLVK